MGLCHSSSLPIVSTIYDVCGAHSTSHTPRLFEWRTHTQHGDRQKGTVGWLRVAHVYAREKGMYPSLCHLHVRAPIHQSYPLSLPSMLCVAHIQELNSSLFEWRPHTYTHKTWLTKGYRWLNEVCTRVWQRERYEHFPLSFINFQSHSPAIPLVSPIHVAYGTHSTSHTPPPSPNGWMIVTHKKHGSEKRKWLAEWGSHKSRTET